MSTRVAVLVAISALGMALGIVLSCTKEKPAEPSFTNPLDERNTDTRLQIRSVPDSAKIIIDGKNTGAITPHLFVPFQPGTISVVLEKIYYRDFGPQTIVITEGRLNTVSTILYRGIGGLTVNSVPSGALIEIDRSATSYTTPHDFDNLFAGIHTIALTKRFYEAWGPEPVTVQHDATVNINADLTLGSGTLTVTSEPFGCGIHLDGQSGHDWITPYMFSSIDAGWHAVEIEAPSESYVDSTVQIAVDVGETANLHVTLRYIGSHADVVMAGDPNIIPYGYSRDAKVVGQVRNRGEITARYTKIFITFYDGLDSIIGTQDCYVDDTVLEPGEQCTFECWAYGVPYDNVSYYTWTFSWSEY